jgi:hypothetical protein
LWANILRPHPRVATRRERLELSDGDFLDLDWTLRDDGPVVLVLHGLEGSIQSNYAAGILAALHRVRMRAVLMHFRGCSGEPNRRDRGYHSGDTEDVATVVALLRARFPEVPQGAVGYSLGGNVLLKWLGECGTAARIDAAVAVSVPFDLHRCAARLERGGSRLYQAHLLHRLRRRMEHKFAHRPPPVDWGDLARLTTFRQFDDRVTAPLHGFAGVDDYYTRASSRQYLRGITVPTLILHARDDPFMETEAIPVPHELSSTVTLELSEGGGHVGFVTGMPWRPSYWLEERIPQFLTKVMGSTLPT